MERPLTEQKNSRILGKGKTAKKEKNDKKNKKSTKTEKKRNNRLKKKNWKEEKKKRRPGRIELLHVPMPLGLKPSPDTSQNQVGSLLCKCVCPLFPFPTASSCKPGEANQTKEENKKEET